MLEKDIESFLVRKVREMGGTAYKFVSPGNTGVPDRIVVLPGNVHISPKDARMTDRVVELPDGRIIFVELKTEKGKLSLLQERQIAKLRKMGCDVRVLYGIEQVKEFLEECKGG